MYCCALAMFQIVVSLETFFSCRMTCSVKSQVFFSSLVENLSYGKISKVTFLFWQQMAVFSGTIVVYLLSTKESYTVFLSRTTALHQELVHTGALGLHRTLFFFCNRKRKSLECIVPLLESFRYIFCCYICLEKLNLFLIRGKTSFVHTYYLSCLLQLRKV